MSTSMPASATESAIVAADVTVLGAGPAGCSCALWLQQSGLRCVLVDQANEICSGLRGLDFAQDWVLGEPHSTLDQLARKYAQHMEQLPGLTLRLGVQVVRIERQPGGLIALHLADAGVLETRALVLATGLQPRRPALYFGGPGEAPLDAHGLTLQRPHWHGARVLLLGGGDNAVENAAYLHDRGNHVTLWSRSALRAAPALAAQLQTRTGLVQRIGHPAPDAVHRDAQGFAVHSGAFGTERFDQVAVLFGFEPRLQVLQRCTPPVSRDHAWPGMFFAGDVSERLHPSVATAQADGVTCAKQVQRWLQDPGQTRAVAGPRILHLNGLRFSANLGILEHEKLAPQPIQVDAELNLGAPALLPRDDEIHHVLDYRKVRKIIIDECTAEHTNLLESLLGKLALRLMQLPGVLGVRVQIAKLEIFDDCQVAIRTEVGRWP